MKFSRSVFAKVAAAAVALAALGTASVAQARSNVYFSVGANVAPGVVIGASNYGPAYYPPVYTQPYSYYVQPAPVYYSPTYYAPPPPIYYRPAPVYFGARFHGGHRHHIRSHGHRHHR
jgi:hypothetical protein